MTIRNGKAVDLSLEAFEKEQLGLIERERRFWACLSLIPVKPGELASLESLMKSIALERIPNQLRQEYDSAECLVRIDRYKLYYPHAEFEGFMLTRDGVPYHVVLERLGGTQHPRFVGNELDDKDVREGVICQLAARVAVETGFKPTAYLMGNPYRDNNGAKIAHVQFYHNELWQVPDVQIVGGRAAASVPK